MKYSIIISNRNDLIPFNVTIRDAIEAMKGVDYPGEIVVCDNSEPHYREQMYGLIPRQYRKDGTIKVVELDKPCFTMARRMAAQRSRGEYVFCVDSHVLFGRNVLKDSIDFMESMKDKPIGFGHPPVNWAGQGEGAKRHSWDFSKSAKGAWGYKVNKNQKIEGKYMPWIARKNWYLNTLRDYGCLADKYVSWGGAEMLQQHKAWCLGYENWAIDTDPVIHLGPYSKIAQEDFGYKYRVYRESGDYPVGIGWLVAFYVLGGQEAKEYVRKNEQSINQKFGITVGEHWDLAVEIGKEDREWFNSVAVMDLWEMLEKKPWTN